MKPMRVRLPSFVTLAAVGLLLLHGPIAQWPDYHDFADRSVLFGIPQAGDVLSNLGFALVGAWGLLRLRPRDHPRLRAGWPGYRLFLVALVLTAIGSAWYHLAPDNARLAWDRLPIALACAGLLAAVRAETRPGARAGRDTALLALAAAGSVAWWHVTETRGAGDLRPYILVQMLPLVLIPMWQAIHGSPVRDRLGFGAALLLYVLAKAAELLDHEIAASTGWISGHTLKHLLATAAAAAVIAALRLRLREAPLSSPAASDGGGREQREQTAAYGASRSRESAPEGTTAPS